MQQQICQSFYTNGYCKHGKKCYNMHISPNMNPNFNVNMNPNNFNPNINPNMNNMYNIMNNNQPQMPNMNEMKKNDANNTCYYFLQGNCTKKNCVYFHGYGNKLQYISYNTVLPNQILNIELISENKFILCDEHTFKIFLLGDSFNQIGETTLPEGKINKLFYSKGKIIIVFIKETL